MSRKQPSFLNGPSVRTPFALGQHTNNKQTKAVADAKKYIASTIEHSHSREMRRRAELSVGVTTELKASLKQQLRPQQQPQSSHPIDTLFKKSPVVLIRKKSSCQKRHNLSQIGQDTRHYSHNSSISREKDDRSAHNSVGRIKHERLNTEKVSLNPSQSNIIKKRKISLGIGNSLGVSTELKRSCLLSNTNKNISYNLKTTPVDDYGNSVDSLLLSTKPNAIDQQAVYNRAIEYLSLNKMSQAVKNFETIIQYGSHKSYHHSQVNSEYSKSNSNSNQKLNSENTQQPRQNFRNSSFLWLAISLKKLGRTEQALEVLNRALIEYPRHYESYVYRGKLLVKLKKFERAKKDLNIAISLEPLKPLAYLAKGDCLKISGQVKEALEAYTKGSALETSGSTVVLLKKITLQFEQEMYDKCLADIENLLSIQPTNSQALCFKGMMQKQNPDQLVDATLTFQQALKHNNSRKASSKALYELAKIKMEARDYYEAYYTLCRAKHLDVDPKVIQKLRLFNEGAILLMKRKFSQALSVYDTMLQEEGELDSFLKPLFHMFRAYGYFCLGRHKDAVRQYQKLAPAETDDISRFNTALCEGIILVEKNKYFQGLQYFQKAKKIFPNKVEPYIYVAVTYVREAREGLCSSFEQVEKRKQSGAIRAIEELNQGNLINDSNSNLLYHRAVINMFFKDWLSALEDINRCIQKAQDNIPKYFYLRGLAHAANRDLLKGINEFSICTSLDKQHSESYVERAKCLFLIGDTDKAFCDLHTYMQLQNRDVSIHKWIGDLLYESKSYSDAHKTYCEIEQGGELNTNNERIQYCWGDICLMKAKCEVRLGLMDEARASILMAAKLFKRNTNSLGQVNGNSSPAKSYSGKVDICALNLLCGIVNRESNNKMNSYVKRLNEAMEEESKGEVFRLIDCMFLIGCAAFLLGKFADASSSFELSRQLFQSCSKRNKSEIKSEVSEEFLNLSWFKINFNLFLAQVGIREYSKAFNILRNELIPCCTDPAEKEVLANLLVLIEKTSPPTIPTVSLLLSKRSQVAPNRFEISEVVYDRQVVIKAKLMYGLFHEVCCELYPVRRATEMLDRLTPIYVEDKPEAPWIRRNNFGVVFTENILKNESVKLDTTLDEKEQHQELERLQESIDNKNFNKKKGKNRYQEDAIGDSEEQNSGSQGMDLKSFKERMRLDLDIEEKLNRVLKKSSK